MKEYSISQLHLLMKDGKITGEELVSEYIERIDQIDRSGPHLNAVIELNPEVIDIARQRDAYLEENNEIMGNLHGIPIMIKDNFDTADKMKTTAGSISISKHGGHPTQDAHVVKLLRDAGAIIMGKTNLSEMANFRGQRSTSGWSSRGGLTKNPYVLNRNTSGSSSGSAVAVAANQCTVTLGTETDGSVISPASVNGIVGLKPSIGLVSRSGIIPIAASQDTAGPMGRTVHDVAILMEAMVGRDELDPVTAIPDDIDTNYTRHLNPEGLRESRIGVFRKNFGFHKDVDYVLEEAMKVLEDQGATLIDPVELEYPEDWGNQELTVLLYEYKEGLNDYFATRAESAIKSIDDLIEFNEEYADEVLPYFGQEHLINAAEKESLEDEEYQNAISAYDKLRENFNSMMKEHDLDAIIGPSNGPAWMTDLVNGDSHFGGSSQLAAVTGYCHITVPAGYVHGLPIGLSFLSGEFKEATLFKLAYAFEQATRVRNQPEFKISAI